jgi:hypothetical protein
MPPDEVVGLPGIELVDRVRSPKLERDVIRPRREPRESHGYLTLN